TEFSCPCIELARLLLVVILAIVFFIFGMLLLVIRCITKRPTFSSVSHSNRSFSDASNSRLFQRQLQQLFRLHDSGLDQSLVNVLPIFYYKEITGLKEPFDCAVCLGEFSNSDKLKILPDCSHAFHIHCIETWLMSNSTCPLCRTPITNISSEQWDLSCMDGKIKNESCSEQKSRFTFEKGGEAIFSVRLDKLRGLNKGLNQDETNQENAGIIISCGNLDARRCYSMGAFQYIVGDNGDNLMKVRARFEADRYPCVKDGDGKRIINGRRSGDSLSVSKIWLWSKKGKFSLNTSGQNDDRGILAENNNSSSLV
ncbi:RING-H2 finger protein ATL46-like, partial [Primulina tabacum]|uniref:RING-H2 finger protein ATL46-like n=1 Tax=Primulina tabacum TaxID=48773 RepID=UPI003F59BF12